MHSVVMWTIMTAALVLAVACSARLNAHEPPSAAAITERLTPITGDEDTSGNRLPSIDLSVEFEYDSARLTDSARALLRRLAQSLRNPRFAKTVFAIYGHSDASGRSEYNLQLSQKRAIAVAQYLVDPLGIDPERLRTLGLGETRLKFPGDPYSKGNRRVEIVNLTPQLTQTPESPPPQSSQRSITGE